MSQSIEKDAKARMQKCVEALKGALAKVRTGRATPALLEGILVDYYGQETPLKQVASINVEDARTLSVTPWEKSLVKTIEKAVMTADLGLNPATTGDTIRVPMPPLTEERRRDLGKIVKNDAENARVAVRNIRRDANAQLKVLLKEKSVTEDEEHRGQDSIQKLTDGFIKEIDALVAVKEADLMEI